MAGNGASRPHNSEASMIRLTPRRSCRVAVLLIPAAMFLTACPASFPLTITHVSATPDPVVGAVVTLEVEFQSTEDEDNVTLQIKPPDGGPGIFFGVFFVSPPPPRAQ